MKQRIEIEDIVKKYPFMYKIGEEIYLIGQGVFKKCTNEIAITYFNKYKTCVKTIGRIRIEKAQLTNEEAENLVYYFRKVMNYSGYDIPIDCPTQAKKSALLFLTTLSTETKNDILDQLEDYVYIFKNYYYQMF